jgi:hypothetical protein
MATAKNTWSITLQASKDTKCGTRVDQSMTAVLYIRVTQEVLDTNKTKV